MRSGEISDHFHQWRLTLSDCCVCNDARSALILLVWSVPIGCSGPGVISRHCES